jgi:signal transduction histidine kinase
MASGKARRRKAREAGRRAAVGGSVSCRVTAWLLELVRQAGLSEECLTRELPVTPAQLESPEQRLDWDLFATLCARLEQLLGGRESLRAAARALASDALARESAARAGGFTRARQLYWLAQRWLGPALFPGTRWELEPADGDRLRLSVEIPPQARACPQLFDLLEAALAAAPRLIGAAPARVGAQRALPGRALFEIEAPPAAGPPTGDPRELEPQLLAARRMEAIGQLASGIAHDFNNLLTAMLGYCELVLDELGAEHALRADAEEILNAAARAEALTRQLLAFSRCEPVQLQSVDLNALVSNVDRLLRRLIGEDVELVTALEGQLPCVRADPGQMEQLLLNLAVNARDAMPGGGRLRIETACLEVPAEGDPIHPGVAPGRYATLAVSDTGVGIDPATRARIFEPFFTTKERGKGTGLGLATVRSIVQQSGGAIRVESEPGRPTTFTVYLPAGAEAAAAPALEAVHVGLRGSETILLVEDEEPVRRLLRRSLERHGYAVIAAASPLEAIRESRRRRGAIDLLVTDAVLPRLSGRDLAARLERDRPGLPALLISGRPGEAGRPGGAALLRKPFAPREFLRRVREELDRARQSPSAPALRMATSIDL